MEKGKDHDQKFSPTPGVAFARIITSIAAANDLELHAVEIEQAFTQTDKLHEGVAPMLYQPANADARNKNGGPDANNKDIVYEVLRPLYGHPSSTGGLMQST
jgi:hypothetical protein